MEKTIMSGLNKVIFYRVYICSCNPSIRNAARIEIYVFVQLIPYKIAKFNLTL